jgi:P-type Ca2+ transporter type 2C
VEPGEKDVMRRRPYPPNESVFSRGVGRDILVIGSLIGVALLALGYFTHAANWQHWQTMVFAALAFTRIFLALSMRSERDSIVSKGVLTNLPMLGAILLTFVLQMAVIYTPWIQPIFQTQPLTLTELLICLDVGTLGFWIVEAQKWIRRRRKR